MIDSCCLVSQSNHLKHSNKRWDWLISVLYESTKHAATPLIHFGNKKTENKGECVVGGGGG